MHKPSSNILGQHMTEPNTLQVTLAREAADNDAVHRGRSYPIMHGLTRSRRHRSIPMTELERALLWIIVCYEGLNLLLKIFSFAL